MLEAIVTKYKGKWVVLLLRSRTYEYIGSGKKACIKLANKLNGLTSN